MRRRWLPLPDGLRGLGEPRFVLAEPVWRQLVWVLGCCLALPLGVGGWLATVFLGGRADGGHAALAGVMLLLLLGAAYPPNWRRWVIFAADPGGIYLATWRGRYHFVAWVDVGPSAIGVAGIGSNRQRTVILPLRVDEAGWEELLGGRKRRVNAPVDALGFRPFGIGNATRPAEETQSRIEALRPVSSSGKSNSC